MLMRKWILPLAVLGLTIVAAAADRLLEKVLDTASGRYSTKADRLGQHDFLVWKREVSL